MINWHRRGPHRLTCIVLDSIAEKLSQRAAVAVDKLLTRCDAGQGDMLVTGCSGNQRAKLIARGVLEEMAVLETLSAKSGQPRISRHAVWSREI
jgi:hypothetical protein